MAIGELRRVLFRFREARALMAGHELGVFRALGSAERTAEDLAREVELDRDALDVLLHALVAIGALRRAGPRYALEPEAAALFLESSDASIAHLGLHDLWHWSSWARLDETLRTGAPVRDRSGDPHLGRPEVVRRFLPNYARAMEETARDGLDVLVARIVERAPTRITDLGGGSGVLLRAVLRRLEGATGCLVDHAFSLERAREHEATQPTGARLELRAADIEKDDLPQEQDLVVISRVLMGLPRGRAAALVRRAADLLAPGGALLIHDFAARSRVGALLSLDMRLHCGAEVHSGARIRAFCRDAGLRVVSTSRVLPYTRCWIAERPVALTGGAA